MLWYDDANNVGHAADFKLEIQLQPSVANCPGVVCPDSTHSGLLERTCATIYFMLRMYGQFRKCSCTKRVQLHHWRRTPSVKYRWNLWSRHWWCKLWFFDHFYGTFEFTTFQNWCNDSSAHCTWLLHPDQQVLAHFHSIYNITHTDLIHQI